MARILSIEAEASQVRVAEVEVRGKKGRIYNCFCIPVPQGAVEDGQIRDTKTLGENLREELSPVREKSGLRKFILPQVLPGLPAERSGFLWSKRTRYRVS